MNTIVPGNSFREARSMCLRGEDGEVGSFQPLSKSPENIFHFNNFDELCGLFESEETHDPVVNCRTSVEDADDELEIKPFFLFVHTYADELRSEYIEEFDNLVKIKLRKYGNDSSSRKFVVESLPLSSSATKNDIEWKGAMDFASDAGSIFIIDHSIGTGEEVNHLDNLRISDNLTLGDFISGCREIRRKSMPDRLPLLGIFSDTIQRAIFSDIEIANEFSESWDSAVGVFLFSTSISPSQEEFHFELAASVEFIVKLLTTAGEGISHLSKSQQTIKERLPHYRDLEIYCHATSIFLVFPNNTIRFHGPTLVPSSNIIASMPDYPKSNLFTLDKLIEKVSLEKFDTDGCNKINTEINNIINGSLSVLEYISRQDTKNPINDGIKEVIFSALMSGKSKFRDNPESVKKYWQRFVESDESVVGVETIHHSNMKPPTEGQILTAFHLALKDIERPSSSTYKILEEISIREEITKKHSEYIDNVRSKKRPLMPSHVPDEEYGLILLSPSITYALRDLYQACKTITHGYQFVSESKHEQLYLESKNAREIDHAELKLLLRKIGDAVSDEIGSIDRELRYYDSPTEKSLKWYNGGEDN